MSIYRASRLVGINNATAKDILRKYRREGTVYARKHELQGRREEAERNDQDGIQ